MEYQMNKINFPISERSANSFTAFFSFDIPSVETQSEVRKSGWLWLWIWTISYGIVDNSLSLK